MNVSFKTANFTDAELSAACNLVNKGKQLSIVLTKERLREISFLIIAICDDVVVGVSCIKKYGPVSEIGYTAVCPNHRRQKIALKMTELLIEHALEKQIDILCGIVYAANTVNRKKLEKLNFFKHSEYLSKSGEETLCWYCHPLLKTPEQTTIIMNDFIDKR